MLASLIFLIAPLVTVSSAAPAPISSPEVSKETSQSSGSAIHSAYKCYHGDGSTKDHWPSTHDWASFDALWEANLNTLKNSCVWNNEGANNSPAEIAAMHSSIQSVAKETKVDARFILVTIMQESSGCVRVRTTGNGVTNPGLMQDHDGSASCQNKNPCPASEIHAMIEQGTAGTKKGDGLKQVLAKAKSHGSSQSQDTYIAARLYNSGSADYQDLNNAEGATTSYVNDIANRLRGWTTATKGCTPS
jgi:hypothetical protein